VPDDPEQAARRAGLLPAGYQQAIRVLGLVSGCLLICTALAAAIAFGVTWDNNGEAQFQKHDAFDRVATGIILSCCIGVAIAFGAATYAAPAPLPRPLPRPGRAARV
jgi:hypothetical protein